MAGTGPLDLHELAEDLLAACVEALDTIPVYDASYAGAPDRAFISPGLPALDCCDQLTVHVGTIAEGGGVSSIGIINRVQLIVHITRCVPGPDDRANPPTTTAMQESSRQIHADKWALWNYLHALIAQNLLFEDCCEVIWSGMTSLVPSGSCGGSVLTITVCFDGYEVLVGT